MADPNLMLSITELGGQQGIFPLMTRGLNHTSTVFSWRCMAKSPQWLYNSIQSRKKIQFLTLGFKLPHRLNPSLHKRQVARPLSSVKQRISPISCTHSNMWVRVKKPSCLPLRSPRLSGTIPEVQSCIGIFS